MKQSQALSVMVGGESVFLTGPPGAGKTFVLNEFVRRARRKGKTVAVTASTGIAATHIGGTTIHSWSGLGIRDQIDPWMRQKLAGNARLSKRYNGTDILVIDEVSMLHGQRLDMVNEVCKLLRGSDEPFGGLQVILVGDLFQLPPVNRDSVELDFVHGSTAWQELDPRICYLSEQHRQQADGLLELLEAMRSGDLDTRHEELLQGRLGTKPSDDQPVTRLYAHNVDIDTVNQNHLAAIDSEAHQYDMSTKGPAAKVEQLLRGILAPEVLELKSGAEVMFVANNPAQGFSNGTRGRVIDFRDDQPLVQLVNGRTLKVAAHSWKLEEDGRVRAEVAQLPLRLAWAITIHKSQGMSLDAAEIDLSKSFTPGMGYVALSRVRSLDGLFLSGINTMALRMHEQIYELDHTLRRASQALAATTPEIAEESEAEVEESEQIVNPKLLSALKTWRLNQATASSVPAYVIAHDAVLETVARVLPTSNNQLLGIKGFGPAKLDKYGPAILQLVAAHGDASKKPEPSVAAIDIVKPATLERPWQPEEETLLLELFRRGVPLKEVCASLERPAAAVWAHLNTLTTL